MERELKVGQHLVFIDADRQERDALLLCIHGPANGTPYTRPDGSEDRAWPCVNLVVTNADPLAKDQYGRQTQKEGVTSIVHWTNSSAHGFCWRFPDEEMTGSPAASIS